jgi:hypothetical protein
MSTIAQKSGLRSATVKAGVVGLWRERLQFGSLVSCC